MKFQQLFALLLLLGLPATAKEAKKPAPEPTAAKADATGDEATSLEATNKLADEKLKQDTAALRAEIQKLKLERELITERLALESAKRDEAVKDAVADAEMEVARLTREAKASQMRAEKLGADLKGIQAEAALKVTRLETEIKAIETEEKRDSFSNSDPVYLKQPLRDDGVLVISDRRIPLNGMISPETATFVTNRIDFWNNRDKELPIFIVIDYCPGGSVMAGYQILKAMESSSAPIHVVVKSFAASMAACITTLAEESYAYPNAVILHHQISSQIILAQLNLTEQKEFYEESQRWWKRLAAPVAEKMGITTDEFIKRMYAQSSNGDWSEFADKAVELKWVSHIVTGIKESSININPDSAGKSDDKKQALVEQVDPEGKPFVFLPRLNPKDVYFLYNPDGYYRTR